MRGGGVEFMVSVPHGVGPFWEGRRGIRRGFLGVRVAIWKGREYWGRCQEGSGGEVRVLCKGIPRSSRLTDSTRGLSSAFSAQARLDVADSSSSSSSAKSFRWLW